MEDVSFGAKPRLATVCTETLQYWGKGAKTKRDPQPIWAKDYGKKKFQPSKLIKYDPRPENQRPNEEERSAIFEQPEESNSDRSPPGTVGQMHEVMSEHVGPKR